MVSKSQLLQLLPPFTNSSLVIEEDQDVPDIMREVLEAHDHFAVDYDSIYTYFMEPTVYGICKELFDFCKVNIRYVIEGEDQQTTKSPSALLVMGFGDCKHYAGFIGGVLSAIKRNTGRKINWSYRFASYDYFTADPGHVFVVVKDQGNEIWIDPVLNSFDERLLPAKVIDKKVNDMALYRVSGVGELIEEDTLTEEDIYPDLTYSLDEEDGNLSLDLLHAIQLLLYYDIIDIYGNVNDNLLLEFQKSMPPLEFERLVNARQLLNTASLGGFFSDIWRGVKKVTMSIPRGAYLSVVAMNVFGTATKLKQATIDQSGIDKVRGKWYALGGDWKQLQSAIANGAKRKRIFGVGAAPVLPAWVLTASAIIAAITPIITSILKQQQQQGILDPTFDPSLINDNPQPGGNSVMDFIKENIIWIGLAAAGGVWYFTRKKQRA